MQIEIEIITVVDYVFGSNVLTALQFCRECSMPLKTKLDIVSNVFTSAMAKVVKGTRTIYTCFYIINEGLLEILHLI